MLGWITVGRATRSVERTPLDVARTFGRAVLVAGCLGSLLDGTTTWLALRYAEGAQEGNALPGFLIGHVGLTGGVAVRVLLGFLVFSFLSRRIQQAVERGRGLGYVAAASVVGLAIAWLAVGSNLSGLLAAS